MQESQLGELYIANVATCKWARGQGIATKLLLDAERSAKNSGFRKCSLLVDQGKSFVIQLYSNLGYQIEADEVVEESKYYRMIKPVQVA